jgi:hypothetical protein
MELRASRRPDTVSQSAEHRTSGRVIVWAEALEIAARTVTLWLSGALRPVCLSPNAPLSGRTARNRRRRWRS